MSYNKLTEPTEWDARASNYIYYTSERNTHLHGYQTEEGAPFIPFVTRLFSTKGRTFVKTKVDKLPD